MGVVGFSFLCWGGAPKVMVGGAPRSPAGAEGVLLVVNIPTFHEKWVCWGRLKRRGLPVGGGGHVAKVPRAATIKGKSAAVGAGCSRVVGKLPRGEAVGKVPRGGLQCGLKYGIIRV